MLWKVIDGFDYEVSECGEVRRIGKEKSLSASVSTGYLRVTLTRGGKQHKKYVHRLVLEAFVGQPKEGQVACHNDGNAMNNLATNLRWDTQAENLADRKLHGTHCDGENNGRAKLTAADVKQVRERLNAKESRSSIARFFNVTPSLISQIARGKAWNEGRANASF